MRDPDAIARAARQLFAVPWRCRALVGTGHYHFAGNPAHFQLPDSIVDAVQGKVNSAWHGHDFTTDVVAPVRCRTGTTAGGGGNTLLIDEHRPSARRGRGANVEPGEVENLVRSYGTCYDRVVAMEATPRFTVGVADVQFAARIEERLG